MDRLGEPRDKAFRRRLGIYLTGVAIGLALLGFVEIAKRATAPPPESAPSGDSPPASDPVPSTRPKP